MLPALALILAMQTPYDSRAFELPEETVATLRSGLAGYVRDAEATRFRGTRGARVGEFRGGFDDHAYEGSVWCVQINGKNAFGAYIGYLDFVVVIAEDGSVHPVERMDRHLRNVSLVDAECRLPADADAEGEADPSTAEK